MDIPTLKTHYPVDGVRPTQALDGTVGYLHVAMAFPQGELPKASFEAHRTGRPAQFSRVHSGVYVPTHHGERDSDFIHVHKDYMPTGEERVALEVLLAEEDIDWRYDDLEELAEVNVWDSRPTIATTTEGSSAIFFRRVKAHEIVMAGLRAIAEFHAINRAS